MTAPTDRDLLVRAMRGDSGAFGELVTRYQASVFNVCYRILHERGEAEDLAQETFIRAYDRLHSFDLEREFGPWVRRIAANLWAEHEIHIEKAEQAWILNPTLGLTYQVTPVFHPGIEGWMRMELENEEDEEAGAPHEFNDGPHVYAGPTMLLSFGQLWWSTGIYVRATDAGRSPEVGDAFGPVYARTIIGVGL